jgi:hypothetical protein
MGTPLNQRPNNIFLSHSSKDKLPFVDGLYRWLTKQAGLKVWYDVNLGSGSVPENIARGVDSCQAAVVVLSEHAVKSWWVSSECSALQQEAADHGGDFRIATMRLGEVEAPALLRPFKHIDVNDGPLSAHSAALLMDSLFGGADSAIGKSVYLSRGWRDSERPAADRICQALRAGGMRLVSDWTDQPSYDVDRVADIMAGTGGLVAILPLRRNGETSPYIISEINMALTAGYPTLIFAHRDVKLRPEWSLPSSIPFDDSIEQANDKVVSDQFSNDIDEFAQEWRKPVRGEHIFLGHSLEESIQDDFQTARGMLGRITGLPVEVGGLVAGRDVQSDIVQLIRDASLCVIDITNMTYENLPPKINFALNSCIEAGIALGSEKALYLTCRMPRRSPPFMFRNKQVWFYEDSLELIGNLRQIAAKHRRMVF